MTYDPRKHHRRSIRLKGYDYTQAGAYFVTIVTHDRECLFGDVVGGEMRLNAYGEIVRDEWFRTAIVRSHVILDPDEFVVMPNHVHGIIWIVGAGASPAVGAQRRCAPTGTADTAITPPTQHPVRGATPANVIPGSLGAIVRAIKSATTKRINALRGTPAAPVWGRNYYEHIIRDQTSLHRIREYIMANPQKWSLDRENPERPAPS
ncbi:MAG: transposase [Anaerolineae bacterium]|nr:transposase [Anaerolineae bacterium]